MSVTLPEVQIETIETVTRPILDMENMSVNSDKLKEYLVEMEESNPEIVKFIARASQMMQLVQRMNMDADWFGLVAMLIMYKSLEAEYAKRVAETN